VTLQPRARFATALALGALTLTGCATSTADPGDSPTSQALTSPNAPTQAGSSPTLTSPSSAPTSVDASIPEAARQNTPEGAQAFALYAGGIFDQAFSDSDSSLIDQISEKTCKTCSGAKSAIDQYKDQNQHYIGRWANFSDPTYSNQADGITRVIVVSEQVGAKVVGSTGYTVKTINPNKGKLSVQLVYTDRWRLSEIQGVA